MIEREGPFLLYSLVVTPIAITADPGITYNERQNSTVRAALGSAERLVPLMWRTGSELGLDHSWTIVFRTDQLVLVVFRCRSIEIDHRFRKIRITH